MSMKILVRIRSIYESNQTDGSGILFTQLTKVVLSEKMVGLETQWMMEPSYEDTFLFAY